MPATRPRSERRRWPRKLVLDTVRILWKDERTMKKHVEIPNLYTIREIAKLAWKNEKTVASYYRWLSGDGPKPRPMTILAIEAAIKSLATMRGRAMS